MSWQLSPFIENCMKFLYVVHTCRTKQLLCPMLQIYCIIYRSARNWRSSIQKQAMLQKLAEIVRPQSEPVLLMQS
jgi:hypothetical protein